MKYTKNAFSLVELLFVVSIIALLATLMMSSFTSSRNRSKDAKTMRDLKEVASALDLYALDNGNAYPTTPALSGNISDLATSLVSGPKKYIGRIQATSPDALVYRYVRCSAPSVSGYALFGYLHSPKPIQQNEYTRVTNLMEPCLSAGDVSTYISSGYNYVVLRK